MADNLTVDTKGPKPPPDAGLRPIAHYERDLSPWRFRFRQVLIPIVRRETPYLENLQQMSRSRFGDWYFAFIANLGAHTFFMTVLPICFWCGHVELGISLVHVLGLGVYLSGALKDMVCLPRPLSPPLVRITMSESAAREYGFPSTHTTNAVSVALMGLVKLRESSYEWSATSYTLLCVGLYSYTASIVLGRMYCGMHGFLDVFSGAVLGASIGWARLAWGAAYDQWIRSGDWFRPLLISVILLLAVEVHPLPTDSCPCFEDGVAFMGVIIGATWAMWHRGGQHEAPASSVDYYSTSMHYSSVAVVFVALRVVLGIAVIFAWRAVVKALLLRVFPRALQLVGSSSRAVSRQASDGGEHHQRLPVPKEDYLSSMTESRPIMSSFQRRPSSAIPLPQAASSDPVEPRGRRPAYTSQVRQERKAATNRSSEVDDQAFKHYGSGDDLSPQDGCDALLATPHPVDPPRSPLPHLLRDSRPSYAQLREANQCRSFSEKPKTYFGLPVATKLVVYAGIAWLAIEWLPMIFARVGLA